MCLNIGITKVINFPFVPNGKLMTLGVPIFQHNEVAIMSLNIKYSAQQGAQTQIRHLPIKKQQSDLELSCLFMQLCPNFRANRVFVLYKPVFILELFQRIVSFLFKQDFKVCLLNFLMGVTGRKFKSGLNIKLSWLQTCLWNKR